jgi:cytochrome c biogenesis protein CcdA
VIIAVLFNIIGMMLAVMGYITPVFAIRVMMIFSIFAILLNTLRVRGIKRERQDPLKSPPLAALRKPGVGGTFIYGFIFSLGTSAAPLLLLLTIAAAKASPLYGLALAFAFGLGRGLPFLVVGFFAGAISRLAQLTWLRKAIQIVSGAALLFVSFYYVDAFVNLLG